MINKVDSKFFLKREDAILLIIDIQEKLAPAMTDPIRTADQTAALLQGSVLIFFRKQELLSSNRFLRSSNNLVSITLVSITVRIVKVLSCLNEKGNR